MTGSVRPVPCENCGALPEVRQHVSKTSSGTRYYSNATCPNCDILMRGATNNEAVIEWNNYMEKTRRVKHGYRNRITLYKTG